MRSILEEWNPWWNEHYTFQGIKRSKLIGILPWLKRKEIIAVMGVRRSGKTTLFFEIIDYLIRKEKRNPKNIFFIKADDDRLVKDRVIDKVLDEYYKYKDPEGEVFVFIDEIQEIEDWQRPIKRIYDLRSNVKFFVSGSNASILKEELSSLLAGRFAEFELFPFTFHEFLLAKGFAMGDNREDIRRQRKIQRLLEEYMAFGAFPEAVLAEDEKVKKELVSFYFDSIFYRDVIKRKNIRNPDKLDKLVKYYLQNVANLANFTRIGKTIDLSTDSVGEYTKILEDAYLVFAVNLFEFSYKRQIINPKKIYCVDTGIRNNIGFKFSEDMGRLCENVVFITLRRRTKEIFYWAGKHECDFIVKEGGELKALQVCWEIENAKEREQEGLLEALEHFNLREGSIITKQYEFTQNIKGKRIKYIPLWKWLLGQE